MIYEEENEASYVERLMSDPRNKINIFSSAVTTRNISGFVDSDIIFGAGASYNAEQLGKDFVDGVNQAGSKILSGIGWKGISNKRINSVKLSRQSWQSSSFNTLAFDLFIVATKRGENPLDEGVKIWDYLLPKDLGNLMLVPGDYYVNSIGSQINATSIVIGDWFRSLNSWLMQTGTVSVSKQKQEDKVTPLYVKISVVMTPARDFYAEEVRSWFITT